MPTRVLTQGAVGWAANRSGAFKLKPEIHIVWNRVGGSKRSPSAVTQGFREPATRRKSSKRLAVKANGSPRLYCRCPSTHNDHSLTAIFSNNWRYLT